MRLDFRLYFIVLVFASCETGLIEQNPEPERLVVNAIFIADSSFELRLNRSYPLFDSPTGLEVNAATVTIFENGIPLGVCTEGEPGVYRLTSNLKALATAEYDAVIEWRDFAPVRAKCIVPEYPDFSPADTLSTTNSFVMNADLKDPQELDYYLLQARVYGFQYIVISGQITDSFYIDKALTFNTNRNDARFISLLNFGGVQESYALFDDRLFNGREQRLTLSVSLDSLQATDNFLPDSIGYTISSLSEDYYKYLFSLQENSVFLGSSLGSNTNLHTNVSNGLGILGSMSQKSFGIRIRDR